MNSPLKEDLTRLLGASIEAVRPVAGGDINQAFRIETAAGTTFLKTHESAPAGFFAAEADGLARIARTSTLRVPDVIGHGSSGRTAWLVLEWIEPGRLSDGAELGTLLAALHGTRSPHFGLERDNFIGSLPQPNSPTSDWVAFFRDRRIGAQLELGRRTLPVSVVERGERFMAKLGELIGHGPVAALLHGDLWSGNAMADSRGRPVAVDPAVYFGDREVEIAFTTLFGGFDRRFYDAYEAAWPLPAGHRERRDVYNVYPLLVHSNLFGGGYVARVDAVMRRYVP